MRGLTARLFMVHVATWLSSKRTCSCCLEQCQLCQAKSAGEPGLRFMNTQSLRDYASTSLLGVLGQTQEPRTCGDEVSKQEGESS